MPFIVPGLAAEKTSHPREVVETALAHIVRDKVDAAYAQSDRRAHRRGIYPSFQHFDRQYNTTKYP